MAAFAESTYIEDRTRETNLQNLYSSKIGETERSDPLLEIVEAREISDENLAETWPTYGWRKTKNKQQVPPGSPAGKMKRQTIYTKKVTMK